MMSERRIAKREKEHKGIYVTDGLDRERGL